MGISQLRERLSRRRSDDLDWVAVSDVRRFDFSDRSDADLAGTMSRLKEWPALTDGALYEACAVVAEAVDRRLGAWRLFDQTATARRMERYRDLAARMRASAPYKPQLGYYTDSEFFDSASFVASLTQAIDELGLGEAENTVVGTMGYVAARSASPGSSILLRSEFYQALRELDKDGDLAFRVTDEQIMAGLLLYRGGVVEMDAGEGKTVAAAFPAVLHALEGKSVHVITANDYLADRDAALLAPVYESLGLTVGAVLGHMPDEERRYAYRRQIVYGTLREFGFDYLRDNLRTPPDTPVQQGLQVAVVDEADHTLIDQARTPLIISGAPIGGRRGFAKSRRAVQELVSRQQTEVQGVESRLVRPIETDEKVRLLARLTLADPRNELLRRQVTPDARLRRQVSRLADSVELYDRDALVDGLMFVVDPQMRSVALTDGGQEHVESRLGPVFDTSDLERQLAETQRGSSTGSGDKLRRRIDRQHAGMNQVHQLLRAYVVLQRNVDYVVSEGRVVLVDELTGRLLPDNRYQHDLHAALETKEGVEVLAPDETLAQTSVPGFMRRYASIAGLTGTALDATDEFGREYGLSVVRVPSAQASQRVDLPSILYGTRLEQLDALVDYVKLCRRVGRPVLVGTVTVEQSEEVSRLLIDHGIEHSLLNAVNNAAEALTVKSVGKFGAVTIATNMAGRGTDIVMELGVDRQIVAGYLGYLRELFEGGASRVELVCASDAEASVLMDSVSKSPEFSGIDRRPGALATVVVRMANSPESSSGRPVTLEFGLGLCVIATEMNQSQRADRQLRGRTARQGAYGSARFVLSTERLQDWPHSGRIGLTSHASGGTFVEGQSLERKLTALQQMTEEDEAAHRGYVHDYWRVLEAQTLAYYRARSQVSELDSIHETCMTFARECAGRLVERHFPGLRVSDYEDQFDRLARELKDTFEIDGSALFGAALTTLAEEVSGLMVMKLKENGATLGQAEFDDLEKLLLVQTSDELWKGHLIDLEGLVQGISGETEGRAAGMARFGTRAFEAYGDFKRGVVDEFVAELLTFPVEEPIKQETDFVELMADVASILEPELVASGVETIWRED